MLNLIIITIGASILIKGGVMVTLGKNAAGLPAFTGERPIRAARRRHSCRRPSGSWAWRSPSWCALHLFFDRTLVGKAMQAVAIDREAARLVGIRRGPHGDAVVRARRRGRRGGGHHHHAGDADDLRCRHDARPQGLRGGGDGRPRQHLRRHRRRPRAGPARGASAAASSPRSSRTWLAFLLLLLLLFVRPRGLFARGESERV